MLTFEHVFIFLYYIIAYKKSMVISQKDLLNSVASKSNWSQLSELNNSFWLRVNQFCP